MSDIIHHPPGGRIEYSGPVGKVWAVNGQRPQRRDARGGDGWEGIEYTAPAGFVTAVGGRPIAARRGVLNRVKDGDADTYDTEGSPEYWRQRRRHELAAERRANPDVRLFGCAVPYDQVLPDPGRSAGLIFTRDTHWETDRFVPVRLDHGPSPLSVATLAETGIGLFVDATIGGPLRRMIGDRRQLSIAVSAVRTRPRRDGVLEVEGCRLDEISLVRRAAWAPHTTAFLTPIVA